jgi:hypothetical protein
MSAPESVVWMSRPAPGMSATIPARRRLLMLCGDPPAHLGAVDIRTIRRVDHG